MRDAEREILGFIKEKGLDLELAVATTLRGAGFSIAQSVGVTDHAVDEAAGWAVITHGNAAPPGHDGREVDVVAACTVETVTVAYIVECKTLQRCKLAALEFVLDDTPLQPQLLSVQGRTMGWLTTDPAPLRVVHDCRAFKLVSKPDKGDSSSEHDPIWNALRQLLDASDDAASLAVIKGAGLALRFPLLVIDAPLFAVRQDAQGILEARPISSALLRVAAHKRKTLREVSVVTREGLTEFAPRAFAAAKYAATKIASLEESSGSRER